MKNQGGMLVAAPKRWDEACFAAPAVRALVASGLGTGILCSEAQQAFWKTLPGLVVMAFPEKPKVREVAAELTGNWAASLAWEDGVAAEAFAKAGIPNRMGVNLGNLKKRITHSLAVKVTPLEHRVRFYLAALEEMGIETNRPEYFAVPKLPVEPTPATVLLSPDSDFGPNHEWPLERWMEVAAALREKEIVVTVASYPKGRQLGKQLAARLGGDTPIFEILSFSTELMLLASYPLVVAADGSLPHLAAHVGSRCVTLFGPNDPAWKRPLGRRHAVVRQHVECAPCLLEKCPLDMRCQHELTVERVLRSIERLPAES